MRKAKITKKTAKEKTIHGDDKVHEVEYREKILRQVNQEDAGQ